MNPPVELRRLALATPNFSKVFQDLATNMRAAGFVVAATFTQVDPQSGPEVVIVFQRP